MNPALEQDALALTACVAFERHTAWDSDRASMLRYQVTVFEDAQRSRDGFARGSDKLADLFVSEREAAVSSALGFLAGLVAPHKQQARQTLWN